MEPDKKEERRRTIMPPAPRWRRAWPYAAALLAASLLPSSFFYAGWQDGFSPVWFHVLPGHPAGKPFELSLEENIPGTPRGTGSETATGRHHSGGTAGSGLDYILNPGESGVRTANPAGRHVRGKAAGPGAGADEAQVTDTPEQENLPAGGGRRLVLGSETLGAGTGGTAGAALTAAGKERSDRLELLAPAIPVSDPEPAGKKIKHRTTGEVTSFAWLAKRRKNSGGSGIKGLKDKAPRYQLSEAFAMASVATASRGPEYSASYSGATYDGNETSGDTLAGGEPVIPNTPNANFAGDLMGGAARAFDDMGRCREAIGVNTDKITLEAEEMRKAMEKLDFADTPGCCPWDAGRLEAWNANVGEVVSRCGAINELTRKMSLACGKDTYSHLKCEKYEEMKIECVAWNCGAEIAAWAILAVFFLLFIGIAWFPLVILAAAGAFGPRARGATNNFIRSFTGYDTPLPPADVQGGERSTGGDPAFRAEPREESGEHHEGGTSTGHGPAVVRDDSPDHGGR